MSLPSGLIFFMDFKFNSDRLGLRGGDSLYGGDVLGHELTGGVNITGSTSFYNLNNGYGSPTGSIGDCVQLKVAGGTVGLTDSTDLMNKLCRYDPDLSGSTVLITSITGNANLAQLNLNNLIAFNTTSSNYADVLMGNSKLIRRLTVVHSASTTGNRTPTDASSVQGFRLQLHWEAGQTTGGTAITEANLLARLVTQTTVGKKFGFQFPLTDNFTTPGRFDSQGAVVGNPFWGLEGDETDGKSGIPEIDIKVDSISVTAMTKKLKAKWTPELGQDLNAYHNLDAEVELTGILSEQIALEIDREILNDLIKGATADTYYWSRNPGKFVHRTAGHEVGATTVAPDFTGTVSEWYETLAETINDVSAQIHRKTLRGGANFVVCGPEVANILEFTTGFRADVTGDTDRGSVGTVKTGSLSKKWDVYVDPYFPRNVVLVGRKGGSFLESGYVYAPYVPLQVTPTIFGIEDFVPRKGVMTRYAKKMVRPDFYGLVIVQNLLG
jgi:hypothetical protein